MPIYVRLVKLTEQGIRGIKGFQKTFEEIKKIHEGEVAKLVGEHLRFAKLVVDKDYEEAYEIWRRASPKG